MAVAEDKTRVMVTLGNDVLERLEAYCKRLGISKSAYISYTVATALDTQEQLVSGVTAGMVGAISNKME